MAKDEINGEYLKPLAQIDQESGSYDDKLTASFLFITREGTCGVIQLRSPLENAMYTDGGLRYKFIYAIGVRL